MIIQSEEFGRVEVRTVPLPEEIKERKEISGTYTYSGRVLVSCNTSEAHEGEDWYRAVTVEDDGMDMREVFEGQIPKLKGANGIRWMCFADNKRILLGDYILECYPDIDRCEEAKLVRVIYPENLSSREDIFCRWSEIIIAPDNIHMSWSLLTFTGSVNYLGRLKREEDCYRLENVCAISQEKAYQPDPDHEGCLKELPVRGGEVKQFIRGGNGITMAGNGDSITESVAIMLDSEEVIQITDTPGYEETTIFSPDEKLGVVMSPRFSAKTNCAIFGLVPQPHSMPVRGKMINCFYNYSVGGVRAFRKGNIGPALIDIQKSLTEGRGHKGVDLSDPEGRWVYCSPMSWHPDSTWAMWNECTRRMEEEQRGCLRICRLLDRAASEPVPVQVTPEMDEIPYALPADPPELKTGGEEFSMKIMGKKGGYVVNECKGGNPPLYQTSYHGFTDDGKSFYNGGMRVTAPRSIFAAGETVMEADLTVSGEHTGEMKLRAVFRNESVEKPVMLSFEKGADNLPESRGYASYDGVTIRMEEMEP